MRQERKAQALTAGLAFSHGLRRVSALISVGICVALNALPAAAQDPGLALVAQLQSRPVPEGWTLLPDGNATLLRNGGDPKSQHMVIYTPAPTGGLIRSTLMIANLSSQEPTAHIALLLTSAGGACMLGLFADRSAELTCAVGDQVALHGRLMGVLNLDGNDRIQLLEQGGEAIFHVNRQELGRVVDHPALQADLALAFSGPADFAINTFSVAHMTDEQLRGPVPAPATTPPQAEAPRPVPPPVERPAERPVETPSGQASERPNEQPNAPVSTAFDIPAQPPRAGWQEMRSPYGITLTNEAVQGDERILPLSMPPLQGGERLIEVDVAISAAPDGQQSLRAAAGILLENPEQGQSCGVQVTAAGDGLLLCYAADGRGIEVARQTGIARGAGPHRLSVLERGEGLNALVNGVELGTLKAHPVIGGQVSLIAWDRGAFSFAPVSLQAASAPATTPPARLEPRPAGSLGDHLEGPLPLFNADLARAEAAYLGVTKSILMHELGHALIGELGVPATGPEEDAVDIYAALHLADAVVQRGVDRTLATEAASYASLLWYYSGRLEEQQQTPASQGWQDEHTGGLKRFRNMFCVIYGADPRGFSQLAQAVGLEERTLARCEDEFLKQNRAWRAILSPYARISETMPEGRLPATAPGAEVIVAFKPSRRQIGEHVRQSYAAELTRLAQSLGQAYALPRPLQVTFQDCDVANAWYYPKEGSVTMCYNIIEHFVVMISDIELATEGGYSAQERGAARAPQIASTAPAAVGTVAQAAAELVDFGIPAGMQLFAPPFRGPTPVANPQARTITTPEVAALIERTPDVMLVDIREGKGLQSLPGAWQLSGAGRDGSLQDSLQLRLASVLAELAGSNKNRPIIVIGEGPEHRAAWNAALRIGQEGYDTSWYRSGVTAWQAAGLPLMAVK